MTPRHAAQQRWIALYGRPYGVCLRTCACGNALMHVGLSHFCGDCERVVDVPAGCTHVLEDQQRRCIEALQRELGE